MIQIYKAQITPIGNSKGIRLPKEMVLSLGTTYITLEQTSKGILIKPAPDIVPLSKWDAAFAKANTSVDNEFSDWDITLNDGIDNE